MVRKTMQLTAVIAGAVACMSAAPGFADASIRWHGCGDDYPSSLQCGELAVPLDYEHPKGARITLGFNRLRASDRSHRVGSLFVNPGGPGGAGTEVVAVEAASVHLWDPELHRRFDLIGMDPRGIGTSTPVKCDPAIFNRPVSLVPRNAPEFDRLASWATAFGRSCLKLTGPLLAHVDTGSVARDMEQLRRALGEEKLNFLGLSYGSHLGSTYAELYPDRIRAMALDAVPNHSTTTNAVFAEHALAYEDTFNRFADWCEHTDTCALHGRDVGAVFDALVDRADRDPIPAPDCRPEVCHVTVTGGELRLNLFDALLIKSGNPVLHKPSWSEAAAALLRAEQGDASAFSTPLSQSQQDFGGYAANCVDYPMEAFTFERWGAKALMGRLIAPHTRGASEAWLGYLACMRWPFPLARAHHTVVVHDAPPILIVGSTHDPSTPYVFAHELHDQIDGSVLLTRDGDGHTSSWLGGGQTRAAITRYLITRELPAPNTVLPD